MRSVLSELEPCKVFIFLPDLILVVRLNRTVRKLLVKVRYICIRGQNWNEGSLDRPRHQGIPVDLLEPRMVPNLLRTRSPQTIFWVFL